MTKKVIRIGGSLGVKLTAEEMKQHNISAGDPVSVRLEPLSKSEYEANPKAKARLFITLENKEPT